ncbi:hypothetical protein M408DRAFT_325357 [Serendipita vermifera MAFF 305830]|uniref:Uncharacterized protein n=1 Tax=Serendipita vermifera MAFF 305830 TaxID=933852 RepID=A0A0C3BNT0_SERVB|nr:hypothetical protein M408DRAFT_325357 [Serendipita vermifera MAFF 305830]
MRTEGTSTTSASFDASAASLNGNARGFPLDYFCIRSLATGKLLDVPTGERTDGQEIILWNEKENSLVESLRSQDADNQVFFVDESGALCSKQFGHALDVEDGVLVLRCRRPITTPYPTRASHALPAFSYDPVSGQILVNFESDPAFPPPVPPKSNFDPAPPPYSPTGFTETGSSTTKQDPAAQAWKQKCYLLTSIPSRKPRTFVDDAADFFATGASFITGPLASLSMPFGLSSTEPDHVGSGPLHKSEEDARVLNERVSLEHVTAGHFDLREDEVLEEERPEEAEIDDDPDVMRRVRVVGYRRQTESPNSRSRDRKRWEILPIRKERRRF